MIVPKNSDFLPNSSRAGKVHPEGSFQVSWRVFIQSREIYRVAPILIGGVKDDDYGNEMRLDAASKEFMVPVQDIHQTSRN